MRKTILFVLLVLGLVPLQADEYEYLWLHSPVPSEEPCFCAIDDLQKITFGAEAMQVHLKSQSTPIAWAYSDLWKMTFEGTPTATAIESPSEASELSITHSSSEVRVESPSPLKSVAIYNLQGYRYALFGQGGLSALYSLNALPAGVYIVRAENAEHSQTIKFIKH